MRRMSRTTRSMAGCVLLVSLGYCAAEAQEGVTDQTTVDDAAVRELRALSGFADRLDWKAEAPRVNQAMSNLWRRNGWSDESDRFALDMVKDVSTIPPWEPLKRIGALNDHLARRYRLTDDQAMRFRASLMREAGRFLWRNGGAIAKQMKEGFETRASGQPFTPDQVARWARSGQPVMADLRKTLDRLEETMRPMLTPEALELLDRDLQSFQKRKDYVNSMTKRWAQGKWRAADWGMENDPIQQSRSALRDAPPLRGRSAKNGVGSGEKPEVGRWYAHDPETWIFYVRRFRGRFGLDAGQINSTKSIHDELYARAVSYQESRRAELDAVPTGQRGDHDVFAPIVALFAELRDRLEAIPTSAQRARRKG